MDHNGKDKVGMAYDAPRMNGEHFDTPKEADWTIERYFAAEGTDPLRHAFSGKLAVHPGGGGMPVPPPMQQAAWEKMLSTPRSGKSAAYIHVPFCETHCLYCGFYNKGYSSAESAIYTDTLIKELQLWADKPAVAQGPIHTVYFGGGTPTALEAADLERLLKAVRMYLPLANDYEMTVEGRLHNFGPEKMEACFAGGANRFSLGVQSFSTEIRQSMGRLAPRETVFERLRRLMSYDQAAVIVDLIFGFPRQDMAAWLADIDAAMESGVDGMDCYQLNVFSGTPLGKAIKDGKMPPAADIPMQAEMFAAGVEKLTGAFYRRLSLTHWARTTRERNLYNQFAKGRADCLAFGPGAGGNLHGYVWMNQPDYKKWIAAVEEGRKPSMMLVANDRDYPMYRMIAESLEQGWVDFAAVEKEYGLELQASLKTLLQQWERSGLLRREGSRIVLTVAGQFWQVNISHLLQDFIRHQLREQRGEPCPVGHHPMHPEHI